MSDLFIPVILGTTRQGRISELVANFIVEQVTKWDVVETQLIDIRQLKFPIDNAGESIKNPDFSALCDRADGFIIVVPEYNHSFPGWLKHVLDTNLQEYIHARWTMTLALPKTGLLPGKTGVLILADIGIPAKTYAWETLQLPYISPFDHRFRVPLVCKE